MRTDQIRTIARREYLTRIQSRGFWIATLLLPLVMGALVVVPALVLSRTKGTHRLAIVDAVGGIGERVKAELGETARAVTAPALDDLGHERSTESTAFEVTVVAGELDVAAQTAALDARVLAGELDSWIRIDTDTLAQGSVDYRAESVSNFLTQERLSRALSKVFAETRLATAGYEAATIVALTRPVDLATLKVTAEGVREEEGRTGIILATVLFMLLYSVTAIYGGLVMNGVLEEKSSRIVEVLLATTTPKELLYGKLLGIAGAGLTQLGVWALAIGALTAPGVLTALALGDGLVPTVPAPLLAHFLLHFLLGFLLFASMYAAIGAATNSVQEAQPLTAIVAPFLVAPVLFMWSVINDPDSTMAVVLSLIPTFTPLLMMLRIAVKSPPAWQIALGYALTTLFVVGLMALCARVYRVGILMYGKRPTFAELGRWIRRA